MQRRLISHIRPLWKILRVLEEMFMSSETGKIDLEQLIQSLNSSRELLIQICSLDNDYYSQVITSYLLKFI